MLLERVRWCGAPLAAFVSSCLLLCSVIGAADVALDWPRMQALTSDLGGWAGLAVASAAVVAGLGVLAAERLGPAPALAVGAVSTVLAVTLSRDITSGAQLVLALLATAVATGATFAAGLTLCVGLPRPWGRAAAVGWLLPLAAGWAPLAWLTVHGRPETRLSWGAHLSPWLVGGLAAVLLGYGLVCQLVDPASYRRAPAAVGLLAGGENCWAALTTLVVAGTSIVMVVGFQAGSAAFVRPVVLLVTAATLGGLGLCGWLLPDPAARSSYLAVVVGWLTGPSCIALLVLASARHSVLHGAPVPWWVAVLLAVVALAGCAVGWRWPLGGMPGGLLLLALGCVGAWVIPSSTAVMTLALAPVGVGTATAVTAGLRTAGASAARLRFVATAGLVALLAGLLTAFPLTWALGAEPSRDAGDVAAAGRVLLGLTFALAMLAAAVTEVLRVRTRQGGAPVRRPAEPVPPMSSGPRGVVGSAPPNATPELPDNDTGARSG